MLATESPIPQYFDVDGSPLDGGFLYFGVVNLNPETSPITVFWDLAGTQPAAQPIRTLNGFASRNGIAAQVYSPSNYSLTVKDSRGALVLYAQSSVALSNSSLVLEDLADTTDVTLGDALIGVLTTRVGDVATTQHQVNEEGGSVFRKMTPAQIAAISAESGAAGAICSDALQSAMDTMALLEYPFGRYQLDKPLRVKNGTSRNTHKGGNRIRTTLAPSAISIAVAPVSINSLFINQDNNAHLCIEDVRFYSSVAYTGVGIYCKEGGGADASVQCLFSGIFRNLWIDFAATNTSFLIGGVQNSIFDTATCENMKGVFTLEGVGTGDCFFTNYSLYNCYDHFILQTADTNGAFAMTVRGVHAYTHQRGRLIDVQNWAGGSISDIQLEPVTGNLGNTGLFKFKNSVGLNVSDFYALTRAGVPACAVGIEVDGVSGRFTDGSITADIGLKISGTGAQDLTFENVDFTLCTTAALQFAAVNTGTIRTRNCKFNNSAASGVLTTVANAANWYSDGDEFLNAGLGGSAGARNIALETSGEVVINRPRIGRNDAGAAASHFIVANGTGTVELIDPIWVGTPPTARITGTQAVSIRVTQVTGVAPVTDASYAVTVGDREIICNRAGTVTLTLPSAPVYPGRELWIQTWQAQTVVASGNVVAPLGSGTYGTAILAATIGKWARLMSNGDGWQIMAAN